MSLYEIKRLNEEEETSEFFLEISEGQFKGIQFNFGAIEFMGEDDSGNGQIKFNYTLLNVPEDVNIKDDVEQVEEVIGIILQQILEEQVLNSTEEMNEDRNPDTQQLN